MSNKGNAHTSDFKMFVTPQQAADILGVTDETVRRWVGAGRLPAKRVGPSGRYRILRSDLDGMVRAA